MKQKSKFIYLFIATILLLSGCKKTTESGVEWGSADFSSFVAIGNSLTAGVADGALYEDSQKNSFPNLIAQAAEINDFEQPLMGGNGYSYNEEDGRLSIVFGAALDLVFLEPGNERNRDLNRTYNNLGIPLIRANQVYTAKTSVEANNNHFVNKILRNSGRTQLQEALSLEPTLMTLWIGNNDVLESATLGLADANSAYTETNDFETHFTNIINELLSGSDAPILVANIIDLTDLPYFTSLPSSVEFGGNDLYLFGDCEDGIRELTDDDLVLFWALPDYLTFSSTGNVSQTNALNDTLILDIEEKNQIKTIINDYNRIIEQIVNSNGQLHLVDVYTLFKNIAQDGYEINDEIYSKDIIYFDEDGTLGFHKTLFSFDGLHPNQFGYMSIANAFIEKINLTFGANIPVYE